MPGPRREVTGADGPAARSPAAPSARLVEETGSRGGGGESGALRRAALSPLGGRGPAGRLVRLRARSSGKRRTAAGPDRRRTGAPPLPPGLEGPLGSGWAPPVADLAGGRGFPPVAAVRRGRRVARRRAAQFRRERPGVPVRSPASALPVP